MNFLIELEDQFSQINSRPLTHSPRIITKSLDVFLDNAYLGADFVCGVGKNGLIAFPISRVLRIQSPNLPQRTEVTLLELLALQKQPVLLECSGPAAENFWLLNVSEGWLRVATSWGIAWVSPHQIELVKFSPVDN